MIRLQRAHNVTLASPQGSMQLACRSDCDIALHVTGDMRDWGRRRGRYFSQGISKGCVWQCSDGGGQARGDCVSNRLADYS